MYDLRQKVGVKPFRQIQLANMEGAEEGSQATALSSRGKCSPPVAFVTSHLTYPHHTLDEYSRLEQSKVMLGKSKEFVEGSCPPGTPIIIAGDFNGTLEDQVSNQMRSSGYLDAFTEAEGPERSSRRITHCSDPDNSWNRTSTAHASSRRSP